MDLRNSKRTNHDMTAVTSDTNGIQLEKLLTKLKYLCCSYFICSMNLQPRIILEGSGLSTQQLQYDDE